MVAQTRERTWRLKCPMRFTGTSRWEGLKTISVVVYKSLIKGKERIDIRYFITSLPLGIEQFSKAVRRHWGIETTCHWSLDVTYSLLKQNPGKDSLAMKRRICGWSDDSLMEVLGIKEA